MNTAKQRLAGAIVTKGIEGLFAPSPPVPCRSHHGTGRCTDRCDHHRSAEAIAQFLPTLKTMVAVGLVTQETVNVVYHVLIQ